MISQEIHQYDFANKLFIKVICFLVGPTNTCLKDEYIRAKTGDWAIWDGFYCSMHSLKKKTTHISKGFSVILSEQEPRQAHPRIICAVKPSKTNSLKPLSNLTSSD